MWIAHEKVIKFGKESWVSLDIDKNPILQEVAFLRLFQQLLEVDISCILCRIVFLVERYGTNIEVVFTSCFHFGQFLTIFLLYTIQH